MGTLYIDRKDSHIRLDGRALTLYFNGQREGIIPLEPIKRVIFVGNMTIETSVLRRFTELGISALFLSGRRMHFGGMLHGRIHLNGILRVKQYERSKSDFALLYAHEIVTKKIKSQLSFLEERLNTRQDLKFELKEATGTLMKILDRLKTEVFSIDSLKGLEGSASAAYFSAYTKLFAGSLGFRKRTRRPPLDPVNAMLSLSYTLLHFEIVREIEVAGLDPTIGFYHQFEYGRESLACDLVELFRCSVDRFVWNLFRERTFTADDFLKDHRDGGFYLKKQKRKDFYPLYEDFARGMRKAFSEEVRLLAGRILNEKNSLSQ